MSAILQNITIILKQKDHNRITLIDDFSFEISGGQILSVMGQSGSGKSTLLHYITGVIDHHAFECQGTVKVKNIELNTLQTEKRRIGLLSQEGLLFPHMTVEENLLYAVPHTMTRKNRETLIRQVLDDLQLEYRYAKVYPHTLSGGQEARLALARTMLSKPQLLLLDEPFSKLDSNLHATIREWVWNTIEQSNIPAIIVTHDKNDIYDEQFLYKIGDDVL